MKKERYLCTITQIFIINIPDALSLTQNIARVRNIYCINKILTLAGSVAIAYSLDAQRNWLRWQMNLSAQKTEKAS